MIQDKQLELSAAQAITVSAASTNQIDTGPSGPLGSGVGKLGISEDVSLVPTIGAAFDAVGAATLTISIRSSPNADMSSPTTHFTSAAFTKAQLAAGLRLPAIQIPYEAGRYVDAYYTVATGPFTAGTLTLRGTAGVQRAS
jgi:hypothetical protein